MKNKGYPNIPDPPTPPNPRIIKDGGFSTVFIIMIILTIIAIILSFNAC